ncbi:hypothetical protein EDD18DRAFT_1133706 [Armillaria luteobubalina]|uniref:DUF6533 domain-containing protein n=1 Tax=Armillaria luteobubalina TaxID=153913 RepID=A0AA39V3S4_9AGAR|nr:hypothetical protein EDD18DRAFT_1133706 [Armillaria luteobubalina]
MSNTTLSNSSSDSSSAATMEAEILALFQVMEQTRMSNYSLLTSIMFLLYDIMLNMDKEQNIRSRRSFPNALYVFSRYYSVFYNITGFKEMFPVGNIVGLSIQKWFYFEILAGGIFFTTVVNIILVMRLNAMYRNGKVLVFLILLVIGECSAELYSCIQSSITTAKRTFSVPLELRWPGCVSDAAVQPTLATWIPCGIVATVFFIMTLAKIFQDGRWRLSQLKSMKRISPLLVSFVRDGAIFYFLCAMFMVILLHNGFAVFLNGWLIAIYSFAASRLILNLREAAYRGNVDTVFQQSLSLSTQQGQIVFAPGHPNQSAADSEDMQLEVY